MNTIRQLSENGVWTVYLIGKIDSSNATETEQALAPADDVKSVIIDMTELEYISSAGLRILLRLKKRYSDMKIIQASSAVYEILEMTGFTEMIPVQKAFRTVSIDGCGVIGKGSNGIVYRLDPETIVKVYYNKDALPDIQHEREVARRALILGIPTAIAYDVVKVGDGYGSVFELLNAKCLSDLVRDTPDQLDESVKLSIDLLKDIHSIEAEHGTFPDAKQIAVHWAEYLEPYLTSDIYGKIMSLIQAVPDDDHLVHGDYHTNNVMLQGNETLLIDMDTLSQGHPVFEFGSMFLAYKGFHELRPETCLEFLGYDADTAYRFWRQSLSAYLNTDDEDVIQTFEDKCSLIGYTRLMRRTIRRIGFDKPEGAALIRHCESKLTELCGKLDSII